MKYETCKLTRLFIKNLTFDLSLQKPASVHHHFHAHRDSGVCSDQPGLLHHHLPSGHGGLGGSGCGESVLFGRAESLAGGFSAFVVKPVVCLFVLAEFRGVSPGCHVLAHPCLCRAVLLRSR